MARIGLDIDSTLHHYWDLVESISQRLYGVAVPYESQREWGAGLLSGEQAEAVIAETHSDENIENAEPYPGAVETVRRWHAAGHWIHVTSHRRNACAPATRRWLEATGIPYDDLHCSFDKITRCVELGIDVLVDDSPVNIEAAKQRGIIAATLVHPWNERVVEAGGVVAARDWPGLESALESTLGGA